MMPLTRPMMLPTPSTSLVTKPSAIIGAAPSVAARASSSAAGSTPATSSCSAALARASSVTSLIWSAWSVTPRTVATTTPAINSEQSEHDHAGGQGGLELVPLEHADQRFEDDGQHRGERSSGARSRSPRRAR